MNEKFPRFGNSPDFEPYGELGPDDVDQRRERGDGGPDDYSSDEPVRVPYDGGYGPDSSDGSVGAFF